MAGRRITIRHTAEGVPYARPYLGTDPITHKKIRPYREFPGMTDEEAQAAALAWVATIEASGNGLLTTTGDVLDRYVTQVQKSGRAPNTVRSYRLYSAYARPIAKIPVAKVTTRNLDDLFSGLLTNGGKGGHPLSLETVRGVRQFLKGAFDYAKRNDLVEHNPVINTMKIHEARNDAMAIDEASIQPFVEALRADMHRAADGPLGILRRNAAMAMYLSLNTGLRVGEVAALRRKDIRLAAKSLSVNGTVIEQDGEAVRQGKTKGKRSRNVAIAADLAAAIKEHLEWQRTYLDRVTKDTPLVTLDGGHMRPTSLSRQFARMRDELGLDRALTFHSLRHTHATILLQGGTDMRTVQERLGHADVGTTLRIYGHVMPGRDREAAEAFERITATA